MGLSASRNSSGSPQPSAMPGASAAPTLGAGHDPYIGSLGHHFNPNGFGYQMLRAAAASHNGGTLPANWYPGYFRDFAAQGGAPAPAMPVAPAQPPGLPNIPHYRPFP